MEQIYLEKLNLSHDMDSDAARKAIERGLSVALSYTRKHSSLSTAMLADMKKVWDESAVKTTLATS